MVITIVFLWHRPRGVNLTFVNIRSCAKRTYCPFRVCGMFGKCWHEQQRLWVARPDNGVCIIFTRDIITEACMKIWHILFNEPFNRMADEYYYSHQCQGRRRTNCNASVVGRAQGLANNIFRFQSHPPTSLLSTHWLTEQSGWQTLYISWCIGLHRDLARNPIFSCDCFMQILNVIHLRWI